MWKVVGTLMPACLPFSWPLGTGVELYDAVSIPVIESLSRHLAWDFLGSLSPQPRIIAQTTLLEAITTVHGS